MPVPEASFFLDGAGGCKEHTHTLVEKKHIALDLPFIEHCQNYGSDVTMRSGGSPIAHLASFNYNFSSYTLSSISSEEEVADGRRAFFINLFD